jgi:hypothetical protein
MLFRELQGAVDVDDRTPAVLGLALGSALDPAAMSG